MLFKPYMSKAVLQTSFSQQQRIMTNAQYNKNICQDHDALLHSIPSLYDSYSRCLVCKQPYSYTFTLSLRARRGSTCIGCARLLGPYKHDLETREMIIEMLSVVPQNYNVQKTAEVAETIDKQEASVRLKETFEQLEEPMQPMFEHSYRGYEDLAARSRRTMKVRLRKTGRHGYIPSREELIQLMKASQGRCAVSGIKGHWGLQRPSFFKSPFDLDFDHKIPISLGGSFGLENLQVTINCLNSVKGGETDEELKRWLKGFRENRQAFQ